jgi:hypothetical protein
VSEKKKKEKSLVISAPNMEYTTIHIRGTSPYCQNRFSQKAKNMIMEKQKKGDTAKKDTKKKPKNFEEDYENAKHISEDGWLGIPAPAFRTAMISACRVAGFVMTKAKLSVFVVPNGLDPVDNTPLVKITKGKPKMGTHRVTIENNTTDIRARPVWQPGWEAKVTIQYDADMFQHIDIVNLMMRVGIQVGIGESRHDSKRSCGYGWGCFEILSATN